MEIDGQRRDLRVPSTSSMPVTAVQESEQVWRNCPEMLASCLPGIIDTASFRTQQSPAHSLSSGGNIFVKDIQKKTLVEEFCIICHLYF